MIVKNEVIKQIAKTRDEHQTFLEYISTKYLMDDSSEISLAKGWVEALDYVLNVLEYRTSMQKAADAENVSEETLKIQEMIHCEDGHCDT